MSGAAKRAVIAPVLGWMQEPVSIPADLDAALDHGVASPGTAFHTRRAYQLGFVSGRSGESLSGKVATIYSSSLTDQALELGRLVDPNEP